MYKILVINDISGEIFRELSPVSNFYKKLVIAGYDVSYLNSDEEHLNVSEIEADIIIFDLNMLGNNGLEILKELKEHNVESEVIAIADFPGINLAVRALKDGASDYVLKPLSDEALFTAINRAKEKLLIKLELHERARELDSLVRMATEEVKAKSEFQAKLISSLNEGIIATDENGVIIIYNPGAELIFGYPRSQVIRKMKAAALFPDEIIKQLIDGLGHVRTIIGYRWQEIDIIAKNDVKVPTKFSFSVLYEKNEVVGSVAFIQDLRDIKRLEKELVRSERMAAIGETVAGLAHYIKNILAGLKGGSYVANIGIDKGDNTKLRDGWQMIQNNIGRISDLVLDLLTYSREHKPVMQLCSPNDIVNEVCDLMSAEASENNISIIRNLDASIKDVFIDSYTVHHSLLNLVSNAIDACIFDEDTTKEYKVTVTTAREKEDIIVFQVIDNGCGMTDEVKNNLFSSIFTTKLDKGNGLGLLVSNKLLKENNGTLTFDSSPGQGSTFTIRIGYSPKR